MIIKRNVCPYIQARWQNVFGEQYFVEVIGGETSILWRRFWKTIMDSSTTDDKNISEKVFILENSVR